MPRARSSISAHPDGQQSDSDKWLCVAYVIVLKQWTGHDGWWLPRAWNVAPLDNTRRSHACLYYYHWVMRGLSVCCLGVQLSSVKHQCTHRWLLGMSHTWDEWPDMKKVVGLLKLRHPLENKNRTRDQQKYVFCLGKKSYSGHFCRIFVFWYKIAYFLLSSTKFRNGWQVCQLELA